jgi:anti-sigma regulatory factor (Ser/Thr protein kinase)
MTTAPLSARAPGSTPSRPTACVSTSLPEGGVLHQDAALAAFPAEARWLGPIRSFASCALGRWPLPDDTRDAAMAILGELTANAVVHGRSELHVLMTLSDRCLTLYVRDSGEMRTASRESALPDDEHGRGLLMVDVLAERWEAVSTALGWRCTAWLQVPDSG